MKHVLEAKFVHKTEPCERGCCSTSYYDIVCSCGTVIEKKTSYIENLHDLEIEHRINVLEQRMDSIGRARYK